MSSNNGDRSLLYRGLERLSTEELKEALRADTFGAGQAMDEETFLTIADILYEREGRPAAEREAAVDAALEEFWTVYANTAPEEDLEELIGAVKTEPKPESVPTPKKPVKRKNLRRLIAVAAVLCLVSIPVAKANDFNIIKVVNRLVAGQFSFSSPGQNADVLDISKFQDKLKEYDLSYSFEELWLPEAYFRGDLSDKNYAEFHQIEQIFLNDQNQVIFFDFKIYHEKDFDMVYEEELEHAEIYSSNQREYYIVQNTSNITATTFKHNVEFAISGDITMEEMHKIIDSIY